MPLVLDGTNGVSGVDGTASNPAIEGTDSNTGIFYPAADTVAIGTGGTERLRLDASGNLMLGATTASGAFYIQNSTNPALRMGYGGANALHELTWDSGDFVISADRGNAVASNLIFRNDGTERARITSGGDFLVGTTNTSQIAGEGLKITDVGRGTNAVASYSTSAYSNWVMYSTGVAAYRFYVGWNGTIYATSTTITAISDQRLKENIQDIDVGLEKIMALKPRKFDWKAGKGKDIKGDRGWIAQEFEQVFPDMIDTWKDEPPEGEEPYKAVNADLIPVLVKAIQELNAKVEAQAAEIAALKAQP